jgi:Kef-type K+ transport system membrane component KefB
VALVIASAGLAAGAVGPSVFSAAIVMTLVTTILTPILLKLIHVSGTATYERMPQMVLAEAYPVGEAGS